LLAYNTATQDFSTWKVVMQEVLSFPSDATLAAGVIADAAAPDRPEKVLRPKLRDYSVLQLSR